MAIEKTVSEIAEILGVSRQAVNNRVKALAPEDTLKLELEQANEKVQEQESKGFWARVFRR